MKRPSKQFCLICLLALFGHMATAVASTSTAPMPNNFVELYLTPSSFEIGWGETEGYAKWGVVLTDGEEELARSTTTYPHMVFNNLHPDQDYSVSIYSVGENNEWHEHITNTVHTPCTGMSGLPYTEDFETMEASTLPHCWQVIERGSAHCGVFTPGTDYRENYGKCISLNHLDEGRVYLILPAVDTANYPVNLLQLRFRAQETTAGRAPICTMGVMTDPASAGSYAVVERIEIIDDGNWHEYTASLFDFCGWGSYITLQLEGDGLSQCFKIDDVVLEEIPACPRVEDMTADNITLSSAQVSWTAVDGYAQWMVEYGPRGFAPSTGITMQTNDTTLTLTGLNHSTEYEVRMTTDCGMELGGTNSIIFSTLCTIDEFPYFEDFEDARTDSLYFMNCWTSTFSSTLGTPRVDGEGENRVMVWPQVPASNDSHTLALPPLENAADNLQISFDARARRYWSNRKQWFLLGTMDDPTDASTFRTVDTVVVNAGWQEGRTPNNGEWQHFAFNLQPYLANSPYIAFARMGQTNDAHDWHLEIDNVTIGPQTQEPEGIAELMKPSFSLTPNPTDGVVRMITKGLNSSTLIEVLDIAGRRVAKRQAHCQDGSPLVIDLSHLPQGTYLVKCTGAATTQKLVIMR